MLKSSKDINRGKLNNRKTAREAIAKQQQQQRDGVEI